MMGRERKSCGLEGMDRRGMGGLGRGRKHGENEDNGRFGERWTGKKGWNKSNISKTEL